MTAPDPAQCSGSQPAALAGPAALLGPAARLLRAGVVALLYGALATALSALLAGDLEAQLAARGLRSSSDVDLLELYLFEGLLSAPALTLLFSLAALGVVAPLADVSILLALRRETPSLGRALLGAPRHYLGALLRAIYPAGALLLLALGLGVLPYLAYLLSFENPDDHQRLVYIGLAAIPALLSLALYPAAVDRARITQLEAPERGLALPLREIAIFAPLHLALSGGRIALIECAPDGPLALFAFASLAALVRALTLALHRAFALRRG